MLVDMDLLSTVAPGSLIAGVNAPPVRNLDMGRHADGASPHPCAPSALVRSARARPRFTLPSPGAPRMTSSAARRGCRSVEDTSTPQRVHRRGETPFATFPPRGETPPPGGA